MNKSIIGRGLAIVLALSLVFASSLQVFAVSSENTYLGKGEYFGEQLVYVNPFYEQLENYDSNLLVEGFEGAPVYKASSKEEVLEAIRNAFANRVTAFVVKCSTYYDYQVIFNEIKDHTGNPRYGDYLAWNTSTIRLNYSIDITGTVKYYCSATFLSNSEQEKAVDERIPVVMSSLDLEGKDDYNKVKAIYDYICSHVVYDFDNLYDNSYTLKHSTYAALIDGKAVCQGYATLFYRMCLEAGIDARLISGLADTGMPKREAHAWNIVKLGEYYYNIDSTWDAGTNGDYSYFLRGESFDKHFADKEYLTEEFKAVYPISKSRYVYDQSSTNYKLTDGGKTLVISGTGDMAESKPWASEAENVTKIVIENGITSICNEAFKNYPVLDTVELADSIKYIGANAFEGCKKLENVKLGDSFYNSSLKEIGASAFRGCIGIEKILIPANVMLICEDAFADIPALKIVSYHGYSFVSAARDYAKENGIRFIPYVDFNRNDNDYDFELQIALDIVKGVNSFNFSEEDYKSIIPWLDFNCNGKVDIRDYNYLYNAVYAD